MIDSAQYTPETIARRIKIAQQLLDQSRQQPIVHWAQGLNELAQGALGGYMLNKAEKQDRQARADALNDAIAAFSGNSAAAPPMGAMATPSTVPTTPAGGDYGSRTAVTDGGDTLPLPPSNPLGRLNPEFRDKFADLRTAAADRGVNFNAPDDGSIGGVRTQDQQDALYAQGRTAPGPIVTGTRDSNHITGRALDVVPTNGTNEKQIGSTVAALISGDPRFAGMRSGATFSNLYDPLHVELNKPTQVASLDPKAGVAGALNAPVPPVAAAPDAGHAAAAPPVQTAQAMPGAVPAQGGNRDAIVRALMNPYTPPGVSASLLQQLNPSFGFQPLPDGTVLRTDPKSGQVTPIYQSQKPYGFQTLDDGTIVKTDSVSGKVEPVYQAPVKPVSVAPGSQLVDPNTGKVIAGNNSTLLPAETVDQMARQALAGDTSVFTNLGRGAQAAENIVAVRNRMAEINKQNGETGAEQANRNAEFFGSKSAQRTLGNKQANIEMAATEFKQVLPVVQKASLAVDRTRFPDLNRIIQAYEEKTGDPNIVAFGGGVNTLVNLYARAISPTGQPTVSDKDHAREILNKAWSQGQFDAAVGMMEKEINAALSSPEKVREEMRKRFMTGQPGAHTVAPATQAQPATQPPMPDGWSVQVK